MSGISPELMGRAGRLSSATVHEAMSAGGPKRGHLPAAIQSVSGVPACGRAFTVSCVAGSNLNLHRALEAAQPGDILVAECGGAPDFGYWGEVMTVAAQARGLGGLVIDGRVRDCARLREMEFPVFAHGAFIKGTSKALGGTLGAPVALGETTIHTGDLVIADADGVVAIPGDEIEAVVQRSEARDIEEQAIFEALRSGRTTIEIYRFKTG